MKHSNDIGLLLIRLVVGFNMILHGINKIFNRVSGIENMLENVGIPAIFAYGVYLGEVVAPMLIIVGYKTRIAAAVLAINMIVALSLAHSDELFLLTKNGVWAIELQTLFLFVSIALIFTGGGRFALSKNTRWD
jgi:putative oxidoreductase